MSDHKQRELERRFRASGSVEDEAAWLRARAQAGELTAGRLSLAALCGHEAALGAVGRSVPGLVIEAEWLAPETGVVSSAERLQQLVRLIELGTGAAVLRAAVALYRRSPLTGPEADVTVWGAEQRVNPCRDTTVAIEEWILSRRDEAALARFKRGLGVDAAVARTMARCVCPVGRDQPVPPEQAVRELSEVLPFLGLDARPANAAIRAELVPWALGYHDPVRERVEARQREAVRE